MEPLNNSDPAKDIPIVVATDTGTHQHDDTQSLHSDASSHTQGKPSPAPPHSPRRHTQTAQSTQQQHDSPSTETEGSTASPTRSKKRAIDTMLEGEDDKDCIIMEKPPPPLPKRQTPPSPSRARLSRSPPSPTSSPSFLDHSLYAKDDVNYDQACALLDSYRQHEGILEPGAPILDFFDKWIKEQNPDSIYVADALFDLILENYDSSTDEPLVARIPLIMNQILQRKRKEHLQQLFRITLSAVKITIAHLFDVVVGVDDAKVMGALDFLKVVNNFALWMASTPLPRAFQGHSFDKSPNGERLLAFRIALLVQYATPSVFRRLNQIAEEYSVLNSNEHSVLSMMTLVGDVALSVFRCYWNIKNITRFKDRLRQTLGPDTDLNENLLQVKSIFRDLGKFLLNHLLRLMRTEENTSILGIAQLTMTTSILRTMSLFVGPLDTDDIEPVASPLEAMKMTARIAFEGFTSDTKRRDLLEWSVGWYKRQMELDYGRQTRAVEVEAVGLPGLLYVGELFRDRGLLDLLTVDRFPPAALSVGLLFFLFALKNVAALGPSDLDSLYTRFIVECDKEEYWRAWWDGIRNVINNFETDILRNTVLSQIRRTPWSRLYFQPDLHPNAVTSILNNIVDLAREPTGGALLGWDFMPVINTIQYLLHGLIVGDIDDPHFRKFLFDILNKLFQSYPTNAIERMNLADHLFNKASNSPPGERGTDLQLLQSLLTTEPLDPDVKREDLVHKLCSETPSLPEIILRDLAEYKERQYNLGRENTGSNLNVRIRYHFLMSVLNSERTARGKFHFTPEVLESFWSKVLVSNRSEAQGLDERFWGGDYITECMRESLFENIVKYDIRIHVGFDTEFFRFFVEEKLPKISMGALRPTSWEFIAKAVEYLDNELGIEYTSTPMPLLWKVVRESHSSANAIKLMIMRLLRPNVPASVHREFVEAAVDEVVSIGKRGRGRVDGKTKAQDHAAFAQTFEALSLFLNEYRKTDFVNGRDTSASPASEKMEIEGNGMIIARCTQSPGPKNFRDITMPPDTTLKDFYELLTSKLSLVRFRVFAQGREVFRKKEDYSKTIQEWGFKELEAVMIQVQERSKEESPSPTNRLAETWVSARFNELQALLSAEPALAIITSKFLVNQPPQPKFVDRLRNPSTPWEELFSATFPWDLYYSLYVLQSSVSGYRKDDPESQWVVAFGERNYEKIVQLIEWLSAPPVAELIDWAYSIGSAVSVLDGYIHKDIETSWFAALPVERVLNALLNTMQVHATRTTYVVAPMLNVLFTLSSIDPPLWLKVLKPVFCARFYELAVACPTDANREHAWNCMRAFFAKCCQGGFSTTNGTDENLSDTENRMDIDPKPSEIRDITKYLWSVVTDCLIMAKVDIPHAAKGFETAADMLRVYYRALSSASAEDGVALLLQTSKLARFELFGHPVQESILTSDVDYITLGWTRILQAALNLIPSEEMDDLLPRSFLSDVMKTFLFPDIKSRDIDNTERQRYCIHSETRGALFDILFKLANTQNKRNLIAAYVSDLLEHDSDIIPDENYIDRSSWIQAPSRLMGIHNLSNTCYMNSLVNQLFMNIDFRNFLYGVEVHDPTDKQKLLHHLQSVFAHLQLGNEKATLPHELANAIIDFEGQPINVSVQMDVDEFFNLLFDRLEVQLSTNQEKHRFRKLYGGILRHTIKSRECPHVSSRDEDFAAIQCDVRGKTTLEESLASYVKGEMMDGDNKYNCESCGRHVDAVKQISIKSLPDNLIFHLKRFEYAFDIGRRIKVNDYFQFPRSIDLFPYTLGHVEMLEQGLTKSPMETSIVYDLVGVLIHTGTADSGHYYSYIRDPRSHPEMPESQVQWYEFNDSDVKPWKIEELDHWCFGGPEPSYDTTFLTEAPNKSYSAYMLFYRKRPKSNALALSHVMPKTLMPPPEVNLKIQRSNDEFIRKYVLFGDDFCAFVANLLRSMPKKESSSLEDCEVTLLENPINELYPLVLGLQVYRLIVTRLEFRPSVEKYCNALSAAIHSSPAARHYFYAWLLKTPGCLKELLLVNSNEKSRSQSASLIATALTGNEVAKPRSHNPENGVQVLDLEMARNVIGDLAGLVYSAGDHWRNWNEYFETLALIATDPDWARVLVDENMVVACCYHYMHTNFSRRQPPRGFSRLKYPDTDRLRPNYRRLITLLGRLLPQLVIPEDSVMERNCQSLDHPSLLVDEEFEFLFLEWEAELPIVNNRRVLVNVFVHRLFETAADISDIVGIVKWMLTETLLRDGLNTQKIAIINSILRQTDPNLSNAADALDVIWKLFDKQTEDEEEIEGWNGVFQFMLKRVAMWGDQLRDTVFGIEFVTFWRMAYDLESVGDGVRPIVAYHLPQILGPLLYSTESNTREKAYNWAQDLIPRSMNDHTIPEGLMHRSMTDLFHKLCWQTELFLERKITISERLSTQSVVDPVLLVLRLIAATYPGVRDSPEACIEALQERAKAAQTHHDDSYYSYAEASDEDMEDMETDDEESVVDGSPFL